VSALEVVRRLAEKYVAMVATGEQRLRIAICSVPEGKMLAMCERISEVVEAIGDRR
jgi:hypothetical protein